MLEVAERDHIMEHDIMGDQFHAIYSTIENPDVVYVSPLSQDREVSISRSCGFKYSQLYVRAIIEYNGDTGKVITAFPTRKEEGGLGAKLYDKDEI